MGEWHTRISPFTAEFVRGAPTIQGGNVCCWAFPAELVLEVATGSAKRMKHA
jgi:hypothetical protein